MAHTVLITLHALAGLVAFATGALALARGRLLRTYRWSLAAMAGFLVLAVAAAAEGRDGGGWALSGGLIALAGVMLVRAWAARPEELRTAAGVHHVGFGLVGLFDAFWVVTLLRAGLAPWVVVAVGVGIAVVGHLTLVWIAGRREAPVSIA